MKAYFKLQYRMLHRKIEEIGLPPILGFILAGFAFYGASSYLFSLSEYAKYFYILIAVSFMLKLGEIKRNHFLKSICTVVKYRKLRILENMCIGFPFMMFLFYQQSFLMIVVLVLISLLLVFFSVENNFQYTIPTPFGKNPFEFTVGFRKTFYILFFAYFLTYQSVAASNFNLGVFSLLLIAGVVMSFYSKPENQYFVWIFSLSANEFLMYKIKIGLLYFSFLCLPTLIPLGLFFPSDIESLLLFLFFAYLYISTIIVAKYAIYPNEMNIPELIPIVISLMFPPLLLVLIPYFYSKCMKRLNIILEND